MNRLINSCLVVGLLLNTSCVFGNDAAMRRAIQNGARAKLTFHVTDSHGNPVTNANVSASFLVLSGEGDNTINSITDTNGMCTVEGLCSEEILCQFSKEGYYDTRNYKYDILSDYPMPSSALKDGRWQPWNPTINIILKEKRNPIPMYAKGFSVEYPCINESVGYDLEKGDWVSPHGKGTVADMVLCFEEDIVTWGKEWKRTLTIQFSEEYNGAYLLKKESGGFATEYEAREKGDYQSRFEYVTECRDGKMIKIENLGENEYLVFRIRSKINEKGELVSAQYGKIYGPLGYGNGRLRRVGFTYYLNPTPNDRNLEYDPNENLFDKRKFRGMQP